VVVNFHRDVYCLLGLPFDAVDMVGAVQRIRDAAAQRSSCFISTPNLNFIIGCRADSQFRDSVINSDLSIADGMPLVWIARLLGIPIRERVAGSDLFEQLRKGTSTQLLVYFFGGMEGVAEAACQRLNAESTGLKCVGFESPGFGSVEEMSSDERIAKINASGADFLVVSLGAKKGQAWIEHNRARISVPVISHLGTVLNFAAGTVNRAPAWMQNTGLEWLWRIKEDPMLWRRYFGDGLVFLRLLITRIVPCAWLMHRHKPTRRELDSAVIELEDQGSQIVIRLCGAWVEDNLKPLRECFSKAVLSGQDLRIDLEHVSCVDAAFLGLVMLLQGHQKQHGRQLQIVSLQTPVRRVIKYCCGEYLCLSTA
jgi:N-acetylglucosaminyldiphosphoundecaprenol N-acetyl-beta-D-mannosaminyltransferase